MPWPTSDPAEEPSPFEPWEWETKPGDLTTGSAHGSFVTWPSPTQLAEIRRRERKKIKPGFALADGMEPERIEPLTPTRKKRPKRPTPRRRT